MYGGILTSFPSRSRSSCSAQCSTEDQCQGISYINENMYTLHVILFLSDAVYSLNFVTINLFCVDGHLSIMENVKSYFFLKI